MTTRHDSSQPLALAPPTGRSARRRIAFGAVALPIVSLAGCGADGSTTNRGGTAATASAGTAGGASYPVRLHNCGREVIVERAPQRAVSVNQGSTEILL